ncbi:MAG: Gfo/Idh/MocA family oxidoreductase [Candidatus Limnocylindrales bacterium]
MSVRVGVIGCGWWSTRAHLPALAAHPDAVIAAIADPDADRRDRAGERFDVRARYADAASMLAAEDLDAAIVATPHASHAPLARSCLDRGLHVLVEKPLTIDPLDAFDLVERATAARRELIVGYPYHYVPQVGELRRRFADGAIGRPELVVGLFASVVRELYRGRPESYADVLGYPTHGPTSTTYSDPVVAGGGQGQTQVTHLAALVLWLTGLRPVSVSAMTARAGLAVDLVDALAVRFADGALGSLASTGGVAPTQPEQLEVRVHGDAGHATIDAIHGRASMARADGSVEELPITPDAERYPEAAPAANLVAVALDREPNRSPGQLGATVVALIDAMYRSARSGRAEDLVEPAGRPATIQGAPA